MSGTARNSGKEGASLEGVPDARITQLGKYQLFATLGKGGMADVFLSVARGHMGFNKLAVIKRLKSALADDPAFRNMFLDEARLAARLNHPNIVHTYEVGEVGGAYFIAMEYLEGQALNKIIKEAVRNEQRVPPEIAVRMIADALAGLGYAHEIRDYDGRPLNVIHRDISPHNLFVTYEGHTKLVDFGIAKADTSSTETEVGILKGKVSYMSPEQAMGQRLDARSDLFAMGIVLWELLTHRRLMQGDNAANTLHKLISEPIPHVVDVQPDVDMELDRIVSVALEKDPNRRFQNAVEMREALEVWLASHRVRSEDVSRTMLALFGNVRAEVQKQVQRHMAIVAPAQDTQELQAITSQDLNQQGLLRLGMGGSGSGSGVIANYGGVASPPSNPPGAYPSFPPSSPSMSSGQAFITGPNLPSGQIAQAQPRSNALLIVVTIGCFVLAGLLIVVVGFRRQAVTPSEAKPVETASASANPAVSVAAIGDPITAASVIEISPKITTAPHPRPTPQPVSKPVVAPTAAEDPGSVTLSAYPWAKVSEGSRVICATTPCSKIAMSAGPHTLTFENGSDPTQKQTVTIQIKSGETTTKNIGFK